MEKPRYCEDYPCGKIHESHETQEAIQVAINLVKNSKIAFLGSNGEDGYLSILNIRQVTGL